MTPLTFIQTEDPSPYAQQIFDFWDAYLPGTPHARLDWMSRGNPAGPATWLFALKGESGELVGTISIMPKSYFVDSRSLRAGIVGDFMVHKNNRVFGPTISLLKFVSEHYQDLGFDFLYTVPNAESAKVAAHVGFNPVKVLCSYLKPIRFTPYLQRYMPHAVAKSLSPLAKIGSMFMSWKMYVSTAGLFEEVSEFDGAFDELFARMRGSIAAPMADHSSEYLRWRYLGNPVSAFRMVTFRMSEDAGLSGYMVFRITHDRLEIFDGLGLTARDKRSLLKKIIHIAARQKCRALEFTVSESGEWSRELEVCGFLNAGVHIQVLCLGQYNNFGEDWDFLPGERNI
jgi:hypothetical protein